MVRTFGLLLAATTAVATIDLAHKALAISSEGGAVITHERSAIYVAAAALASLVWAVAVLLTRSPSIALVSGIVLGGACGNLLSIALWPSLAGAPDPILAGNVAFNLADVFVILGLALLVPTTLVFAARNRDRLTEPMSLSPGS